jgi:hypothetical protein
MQVATYLPSLDQKLFTFGIKSSTSFSTGALLFWGKGLRLFGTILLRIFTKQISDFA